jgi:hypothetical protein
MQNKNYYWEKDRQDKKIWWRFSKDPIVPPDDKFVFSFDRVQEFDLFQDYPYKLTKEQKEIFDKEEPFWADFFKNRTEEWEKSQTGKVIIPNRVKEIATELGYPCVGYEGEWKGRKVYSPYYPPIDGIAPPIGLPVLIFQEGDKFCVSTTEEAFSCLDDMYPD